MKIDIIKIAKKTFKDKELIIENVGKNKIKISYKNKNKRTSNHFYSPSLPKEIKFDKELIELIGLYLGDGLTSQKTQYSVSIINKDLDICKFSYEAFNKIFEIPKEKINLNIRYKYGNTKKIIWKWAKNLDVGVERFKIYKSKKNARNHSDALEIHISGIIFRKIFQAICKDNLDKIKCNKKLRESFLRGYFAAEGTINRNKKTKTIHGVSFTYNAGKEKWLRNFCMVCLKKEGIKSRYDDESFKKNEGKIIICNWENYKKLWEIKIFDKCVRKKDIFIELVKRLKVYCYLEDGFRDNLFKNIEMKQIDLAEMLLSTQPNISEIIKGNRPLEITQIKKLCKYLNRDETFIKNRITYIKVYHSSTKIKYSDSFIDLLFKTKSL